MNLPLQSIVFAAGGTVTPEPTFAIVSPSMVMTAFGIVFPSAGLIAVPPTSTSLSLQPDDAVANNRAAPNKIVFIRLLLYCSVPRQRNAECEVMRHSRCCELASSALRREH